MKKKTLLLTIIALLIVLGVAAVVYPKLSQGMAPQQLATTPTQPAQTQPTETEATEAATEPEKIPVPDFTVLDSEGNSVNFSDYLGKPIVLNFWAHWCGPCQQEMPEFNAAWEELNGEVTFLMVHVDADMEAGKEKVAQGGYTFPVLYDNEGLAAAIYGITAFPTTFFVDAEGYLQAWYVGAMERELLQTGIDLIYDGAN